jgi:hypothetical protein
MNNIKTHEIISIDINNNENYNHNNYKSELQKKDKLIQLENILNIPSINIPIDRRLQNKIYLNRIAYLPDNNEEYSPIIEDLSSYYPLLMPLQISNKRQSLTIKKKSKKGKSRKCVFK